MNPKTIRILVWYLFILIGWTVWWYISKSWFKILSFSVAFQTLYWTVSKLILWILPAYVLLKKYAGELRKLIDVSQYKKGLLWGLMIGGVAACFGIIKHVLDGSSILPTHVSTVLINVILIAPLLEEFLCRGVLLQLLQDRWSFWKANCVTSVFFLCLHIPGWFFMGNLKSNLLHPFGGWLSILLLGLAFGYARKKDNSLLSPILAHALNNFFA